MFVELLEDELLDVVGLVTARPFIDAPAVDGALESCFAAGDAVARGEVGTEGGQGLSGGVEGY